MNPVTGRKQLSLVSTKQQIDLGASEFPYAIQRGGGEYIADKQLVEYVKSIGYKLAKVSDQPNLPFEFVILNDSTPNAWSLPGGKIAINRGLLLELKNEAELAAVLSHEIVHATAQHGATDIQRQALISGIIAISNKLSKNDNPIISDSTRIANNLINQQHSQIHEFEADKFGMLYMSRAGYAPHAAVDLQQTFLNLENNREARDWLQQLFASHPPSKKRLLENKITAEALPPIATLNKELYQQNIKRIKDHNKLYLSLDDSLNKINNGKLSLEIEDSLTYAISQEPDEGLFYYGLSKYYYYKQDYETALQYATKAVDKNSNFYSFYLQRGQIYLAMGKIFSAKIDLNHSMKLLPTNTARILLEQT